MLVFFIKQILSLKRAILGRRQPHQLAWGLALGLLLGIVPYGNLLAVAILLFIMSVGVNHGMVAVTAVITTFLASRFDSQTHAVGNYLLTHPDFSPIFASAWQLPVVPWTDINNTVVTGSLVVGLAIVVPAYLFSYPIFHWLAPEPNDVPVDVVPPPSVAAVGDDGSNTAVEEPIFLPISGDETFAIDAALRQAAEAEDLAKRTMIDTRIEVVRMYPTRSGSSSAPSHEDLPLTELEQVARETSEQDPPMSEALNYLLRQLRDARQGRAA